MDIFKYFTGNSASEEEIEQAKGDVQRHIRKRSPSMTDKKILKQENAFKRSIKFLKEHAPYYPDYRVFKQSNFVDRITKQEETVEDLKTEVFYITSIVRHKHNGVWYARHHVQTRYVSLEELDRLKTTDKLFEDVKLKLIQQLTRAVYLDLKFGIINPDLTDWRGREVDPEDDLQISEKERLNLD